MGLVQTAIKGYWRHFGDFRIVFVSLICLPHAFFRRGAVFVLLPIIFFDTQQVIFSRSGKRPSKPWLGVKMRFRQEWQWILTLLFKESYLSRAKQTTKALGFCNLLRNQPTMLCFNHFAMIETYIYLYWSNYSPQWGYKQGIDQQIYIRKSISRIIMHPQCFFK